jgi:hypothetical protein
MKAIINFTLRDGSKHDCIEKAKEHCNEMMGAELRNFAFDKSNYQFVYNMLLDIVINKKHDKAIYEYVAWREEHNALEQYEQEED